MCPPHLISDGLAHYSTLMRQALQDITGGLYEDRNWDLASVSVKKGGLGLRPPEAHAPAAYLASFSRQPP